MTSMKIDSDSKSEPEPKIKRPVKSSHCQEVSVTIGQAGSVPGMLLLPIGLAKSLRNSNLN